MFKVNLYVLKTSWGKINKYVIETYPSYKDSAVNKMGHGLYPEQDRCFVFLM